MAQATSPAAATPIMSQRNLAGRKGMSASLAGNKKPGVELPASLRQRVQDMEETLASMHEVLKQMRAKGAASSTDPLAKANLDMWELMVGHLDRQLKELRIATALREDMEARRAAMYKQAEAKAEAAAAGAVPASPSSSGGRSAVQGVPGQTAADQTRSMPPATASQAPATASPLPN
jgi:hypothetical protein